MAIIGLVILLGIIDNSFSKSFPMRIFFDSFFHYSAQITLTVSIHLFLLGSGPCQAEQTKRPPNVVVILADDLGYRDLGCYGHPTIKTPVLDKLAAGGLRLTGYHSGASVCTPSRMALLTGAYPVRLGWTKGVAGYMMGIQEGMANEALTMAEVFQSEGYATAISGKWHVGAKQETRPLAQGFSRAYFLTHSNNEKHQGLWRADAPTTDPLDNRFFTEKFTNEAIDFIKENRQQPFFLYLPYTAPHFPVEAHPDWKGKSAFGTYGDVVEELDFRIGTLLETLRTLKLEENTIVVFTSDNGPQKGEQSSAHPLRGMKWGNLEGSTRVPCMISFPKVIPAGRESDMLSSSVDLLPTLSRACGIDWKAKSQGKPKIDGLDLWDALLGKKNAPQRTELLHWHGTSPIPLAIRSGDWKLVTQEDPKIDQQPALYNLRLDPSEKNNLAHAHPEIVTKLRSRLDALHKEIQESPILPTNK